MSFEKDLEEMEESKSEGEGEKEEEQIRKEEDLRQLAPPKI